jgi:hypothetical protein
MDKGRSPLPMRASRERLIAEAAGSNAVLVYTHAPFPGWGRIVSQANGYRWQVL